MYLGVGALVYEDVGVDAAKKGDMPIRCVGRWSFCWNAADRLDVLAPVVRDLRQGKSV